MPTSGLITNGGKNLYISRLIGATQTVIANGSVGDSSTPPAVTDTNLGRQVPISGTTEIDACDSTSGWSAGANSSLSLNTTNFKQGTGALNLWASSSTTSASMSKTESSQNFTSKDLWCFVYISSALYANLASSGTAVALQYGSSSSNYYEMDFTKSQLASGWNYLTFNSSTATVHGTPTITSCVFFQVAYTRQASGTDLAGDFELDDIKLATAANYLKAFAVGYPTQDTGALSFTTLVALASTEANGANLQEFGIKNTDVMNVLYSHDQFIVIEKNLYVQISFQQTDQFI